MSWTVQAVMADGTRELPPEAVAAFACTAAAGSALDISTGLVRFERDTFRRLTGFQAEPHGRFSRREVKRAAEDASPQRAKALSNCYGDFDYSQAAEFLRICAAHNLAIQGVT